MLKRILLLAWLTISIFLAWFAVSNYRDSRPMAEENLRGLALSLAAAIENMADRDPSFMTLAGFRTRDIAYFSLSEPSGRLRFHTNGDLIGATVEDHDMAVMRAVFSEHTTAETRVTLGTGETVYRFHSPVSLAGETLALCLTLHTYQADAVVRRSRLNMIVLLSLAGAGWLMAAVFYRFAGREERHRREMARRERLARMGEMGAMLAHEIRNPLAGIKGYAQLLTEKATDERMAGHLKLIVGECLRLERMVNDLLAYVRVDDQAFTTLDLSALLDRVVLLVREEAGRAGVSIDTDYPPDLRLPGDADRLEQLLLNLCKNAVQAMPEGGTLEIKARKIGGGITITVTDTGEGISPDHLARIFEPFFTTRVRGTGLGLALCQKIVEAHKGRITVVSEPGQGTVFNVILPVNRNRTEAGS